METFPEPAYLFECDMERVDFRAFAGGEIALFSARSPLPKASNEDAIAIIPLGPDEGVLAVADGVGGLPDGQQASNLALAKLGRAIHAAIARGDSLRVGILDGIELANEEVLRRGSGGSTLAVAEVRGGRVRSYHVGDSVVLITGQRGRIKTQTVPHSPVGYALESGLIDDREAMVHEDRHLIDNMIGSASMRIEMGSSIHMAKHDTLLLASDGLSDNLFSDEIIEIVRKGPLQTAAERLRTTGMARMREPREGRPSKPDDMTFIIFRQ